MTALVVWTDGPTLENRHPGRCEWRAVLAELFAVPAQPRPIG